MNSPFGVMTGTGAGQKLMYYGLVLPGTDPCHHLRGEGCYDVQRQLWVVGEYIRNHPSDMKDLVSYRYGTYVGPADNQAGSQSAGYYRR
jgi:hypothetical protein